MAKVCRGAIRVWIFFKAQISAQFASFVDFLVTILLVRLFDVYYVYATLAGAIYGGIVNCVINYKWTFKSKGKKTHVAVKFILVWVCSVWLNTWGTYALTEIISEDSLGTQTHLACISEIFSLFLKVVVAVIVALFWNYKYANAFFVYRNIEYKEVVRKKKLKNGLKKTDEKNERIRYIQIEKTEDLDKNSYKQI